MLTSKLLSFSLIGAEWVLWVLVALSILSFAVLVDRVVLFLRTRENVGRLEPALVDALGKGDLAKAREHVRGDSFVRNVLRAGLDVMAQGRRDTGAVEQAMLGAMARERDRYEARLTLLGTIGNNAPFVGLFGTVLGIIMAFNQLGKMDASAAAAGNAIVMGAISEALVATGVGIAVAIPAVAAFNWAKSSIASRVKNAESLMRAVLAGLHREPAAEAK